MATRLFALASLAMLVACEETDNKGWLVDRTRVLGARVEAASDSTRAAIAPGETMRVTWLVGAPNGTGRLHWSYALCAPPEGTFPEPKCVGEIFAGGAGTTDGELTTMDLAAPANAGALTELQLLVAFCEGGAASLDARQFQATCAGGAQPQLASTSVRLAAKGPNSNPAIAADAVLFDGIPLSASDRGACVSSPVVAPGSIHKLGYRFHGDERENVPNGGVEKVLVSHVVTSGELDRQYSMLDPSEAAPKEVSVEWKAPPADDAGRLTEVFAVLRDGRGGAAFARRTLCVRP